LFGKGDRHVTAEMLFKEAKQAKMSLSRAAIYAILHRFTEVGLVRPGAINASSMWWCVYGASQLAGEFDRHHGGLRLLQGGARDVPSTRGRRRAPQR